MNSGLVKILTSSLTSEIKDESLANGGVPGAMGGGGADAYLGWGRPGPLLGLVSSPWPH